MAFSYGRIATTIASPKHTDSINHVPPFQAPAREKHLLAIKSASYMTMPTRHQPPHKPPPSPVTPLSMHKWEMRPCQWNMASKKLPPNQDPLVLAWPRVLPPAMTARRREVQVWMRVRKGGPSKVYGSVELLARMSFLGSSGKSCPSVRITPTYVAWLSE